MTANTIHCMNQGIGAAGMEKEDESQAVAGQGKMEQGRVGQHGAWEGRAGQGRAGLCKACD